MKKEFNADSFIAMYSIVQEKVLAIKDLFQEINRFYGSFDDFVINFEDFDEPMVELEYSSYSCGDYDNSHGYIPVHIFEKSTDEIQEYLINKKKKEDEEKAAKEEAERKAKEEKERIEAEARKKQVEIMERKEYERLKAKYGLL